MSYLKDGVNLLRQKKSLFHDVNCTCNCQLCQGEHTGKCNANTYVYNSISNILETILCPRGVDASFHHYKCVMGTCSECGPSLLQWCPKELNSTTTLIPVKLFQDVETSYEGKVRKRKDLVKKLITSRELYDLFMKSLEKYIKHNFIYLWQANQFKSSISDFPNNVVISVVDFVENYTLKEQNKIQSMHWWSVQVTIFVHITYYRIDGDVKKVIHFFISDDKQHDTLFVQHCFTLHWQWLKNLGIELKHHWVWSDGAAHNSRLNDLSILLGVTQV